jgi:hypothetical protein
VLCFLGCGQVKDKKEFDALLDAAAYKKLTESH